MHPDHHSTDTYIQALVNLYNVLEKKLSTATGRDDANSPITAGTSLNNCSDHRDWNCVQVYSYEETVVS